MENAVDWHGKAPNDAEYDKAMAELRASYEVKMCIRDSCGRPLVASYRKSFVFRIGR